MLSLYVSNTYAQKNELLVKTCDTLPIEGKDGSVYIHFTKIDLNYDKKEDIVVSYVNTPNYGGPDYLIDSIFINQGNNCYTRDTLLPFLGASNPSFFINQNKITIFCLFKNDGYGSQYEWIGNKWIETKRLIVKNEGKNSRWFVSDLQNKKENIIIAPYNYFPPDNVLKVNPMYKIEKPLYWE